MAYMVEVKKDIFEEVGAPFVKIESGTLVFIDDANNLVVAYAQGQWLTVVPEAE